MLEGEAPAEPYMMVSAHPEVRPPEGIRVCLLLEGEAPAEPYVMVSAHPEVRHPDLYRWLEGEAPAEPSLP